MVSSNGKGTTIGKQTKVTLGLLLAAICATAAVCRLVPFSSKKEHNPGSHEERIRALELESVRSEEFRNYVKLELRDIKQAIQRLGDN